MNKVKIYGERNAGTQYITRLIKANFICDVIPGTLADMGLEHRERIEEWLLEVFSDEDKRIWARHKKMDEFFQVNLYATLGWKHGVPPYNVIARHPDKHEIVFITIIKNPYAWLLSLFRRPYDYLGVKFPKQFDDFISEPWLTLERDNAPAILSSPVELWNLKTAGYLHLSKLFPTILVRYEELLCDPEIILNSISCYLEKRNNSFALISEATKAEDSDNKSFSYYKDYYLNDRWREQLLPHQIEKINKLLNLSIFEEVGYKYIFPFD